MRMKRTLLALIAAGWLASFPVHAQRASLTVTLLGTGDPIPEAERLSAAIHVAAGDERLLFDAGRGVMVQLNHIGQRTVDKLFLTHLHSDHVVGIPDLWLTGWLMGRNGPLQVWGPEGTTNLLAHLQQAYQFDVSYRISDNHRPAEGGTFQGHEIREGVVYASHGVTVTAFLVDHRPITPAFGYRVDFDGRSVVLSGDTRFSEALIERAKGADLLIHEVAGRQDPAATQENDRVLAHHTTPEQAGQVFDRVAPKLAVYSHIAGDLSDRQLLDRTRKTYRGPLVVGHDLMVLEVGEGGVDVMRGPAK